MVLRAPFRRTSPNLQRPFLLGFFTFPSFASFVCFHAHLLLRFKKSFICLEDLLLRLFFASFFFGRSTHPPLRSHRERFALGSWHIESVSFVMKRGASPPPLPSLGGVSSDTRNEIRMVRQSLLEKVGMYTADTIGVHDVLRYRLHHHRPR